MIDLRKLRMKIITKTIESLKLDVDFIVGQNATENHEIIDQADPEDLWFHITGQPSCHVIGKIPDDMDKQKLKKIAIQGAVLCKSFSKFKSEKNVKVDYTKIKYVTKLETPGSVSITNSKQITV
jgi:predicted ribosome quality control (RQC) complex YloA/Tae2 family protein